MSLKEGGGSEALEGRSEGLNCDLQTNQRVGVRITYKNKVAPVTAAGAPATMPPTQTASLASALARPSSHVVYPLNRYKRSFRYSWRANFMRGL